MQSHSHQGPSAPHASVKLLGTKLREPRDVRVDFAQRPPRWPHKYPVTERQNALRRLIMLVELVMGIRNPGKFTMSTLV
jgi:hypothetical protein